ncbi:hypothetical protein DOK_12106 [gamma proteobacterium BDW918]|nr:hypothetical protein DOK_12106 [gamma proteobacterium BDW918]
MNVDSKEKHPGPTNKTAELVVTIGVWVGLLGLPFGLVVTGPQLLLSPKGWPDIGIALTLIFGATLGLSIWKFK